MGSYLKEAREEREQRENESKDLVLQMPEEIRQGCPRVKSPSMSCLRLPGERASLFCQTDLKWLGTEP